MLIPSRKRPEGLKRAVRTVFECAADPSRIEVLIRLDDDDFDSPEAVEALAQRYPVTTLVGPRGGGLPRHARLLQRPGGSSSRGVSRALQRRRSDGHPGLGSNPRPAAAPRLRAPPPERYRRRWPLNCFPIFSRDIYEAMGHMSQSPHCDIWLDVLHRRLDLEVPVAITIEHRKHSEAGDDAVDHDEVFEEVAGVVDETLRHFASYENHVKLKTDTAAVAAILPQRKRLKYLARKPLIYAALARRWYWDHGPLGSQLKTLMRGRARMIAKRSSG